MNAIRRSTSRRRLLIARVVVRSRLTLPALMVVALAACDGDRITAPPGPSATQIAKAATVIAPAYPSEWEPIRIEVHFNFITGESTWTSSGAFVDSGSIDVAGTIPHFSPGTFKLEQVVGPLVASDGSTLIWAFAKTFTFTTETTLVAKAHWHFVGGTGRYAGITGQGNLAGDLDVVTGEIHDVFTGWVRLP